MDFTADNGMTNNGDQFFKKELNTLQDSEYEVKVEGPEGATYDRIGSAMEFTDLKLPDRIVQALLRMNYKKPSKIQATVLPLLLGDRPMNLICQSQTGTGKTAAFSIAMIHRVDPDILFPQALCIAPTRELARQIISYTNQIAQFMFDIETGLVIPGSVPKGGRMNAHILVGTPGTVQDCLRRKTIDTTHLKILVMDEADFLLDQQGLGDQAIRVKKFIPDNAQVLLFSATFSDKILNYANIFCPNAAKLTLQRHELTMSGIKQIYMDCKDEEDKYRILVELYHTMTVASSIIFVKRRVVADTIARRMREDGHMVAVLHSALDTASDRDVVIDQFRSGTCKVLITTNLLARGIDVATTSMVVNYDLPRNIDDTPDFTTYLHRIGRTGRYGRAGVSISFVHDKRSWIELKEIQKYFGVPIHLVPGDDISVIETLINRIIKSNKDMGQVGGLDSSRHAVR
ncbi:DEAD-domain-containing protein [Wilcoxina mikolae CBS 423.85]|nr:DEAD-domain-containing protein [Wilcoxina mikolae CBS 423.85]